MDWRERISIDPAVCHGQACVKGTRIPVAVVLDNLAAGLSADEIVASYPPLRVEDVRAATAYAAELARERGNSSATSRASDAADPPRSMSFQPGDFGARRVAAYPSAGDNE